VLLVYADGLDVVVIVVLLEEYTGGFDIVVLEEYTGGFDVVVLEE